MFVALIPAITKLPPTNRLVPLAARARTFAPGGNGLPPTVLQMPPEYSASLLAATLFMVVNWPPATSAAPRVIIALTLLLAPLPKAFHKVPFHHAMRLTGTTPAVVNAPPT